MPALFRNFHVFFPRFPQSLFVFTISMLLLGASLSLAQTPRIVDALEGLDPVLLSQGRETQGEMKITTTRGNLRYYFATEANKATFESDPARYGVQLDGHCARMGPPVTGNPDLYSVHKGRIYIFGSEECKKMFDATPEDYLETSAPVSPVSTASAEARQKGVSLIDRAIKAAGGSAQVEAVKNYQEKRIDRLVNAQGGIERRSVWTLADGRVRRDNISPNGTFSLVATTQESFFIFAPTSGAERTGAAGPGQGEELLKNFRRHPLEVMRARRAADFQAVALGASKIGDTAVERVAVEFGGTSATVVIDAASGRILSLSYFGRAGDGRVGEITHSYSDYRKAGELTLPFACEITVKGKALQTTAVEAMTINAEIPGTYFEKPNAKQ